MYQEWMERTANETQRKILKKIDNILDETSGTLTSSELEDLCTAWKAIKNIQKSLVLSGDAEDKK